MKNKIILLLIFISIGSYVYGQKEHKIRKDSSFYAFQKGKFALSLGANLIFDQTKNTDEFFYYAIDEQTKRSNFKLGASLFLNERNSIGVAFRYRNLYSNVLYENSVGDTVNYEEKFKSYVASIFYGIVKPFANSKRFFLVSDPSINFGQSLLEGKRSLDENSDDSRQETFYISLGLNAGILVLVSNNMSVQATVGPVGVGYKIDSYYLNNEPNGVNDSFFLRMSPDILNFEFSISRYF